MEQSKQTVALTQCLARNTHINRDVCSGRDVNALLPAVRPPAATTHSRMHAHRVYIFMALRLPPMVKRARRTQALKGSPPTLTPFRLAGVVGPCPCPPGVVGPAPPHTARSPEPRINILEFVLAPG